MIGKPSHDFSQAAASNKATDAAALTETVQRWLTEHGDAVWRFVLQRVKSRDVAEEIVQETLLNAMRGHASFSGASSERTWLLGIASHKITDYFRQETRRRGLMEAKGEQASSAADDHESFFTARGKWAQLPGTWGLSANSAAEDAELLSTLRRCIEELPPVLAEAVWLRDLLDIPAAEVCKGLGVTPTNLWTRTHRARAALRVCVEKAFQI